MVLLERTMSSGDQFFAWAKSSEVDRLSDGTGFGVASAYRDEHGIYAVVRNREPPRISQIEDSWFSGILRFN